MLLPGRGGCELNMFRFCPTYCSVVFCISRLVCAGCGAPSLLTGGSYAGGGVPRAPLLAKGNGTAPGITSRPVPGAGVDMP